MRTLIHPAAPPRHRYHARAGFTLAEVLAGVTILGLIAGAVLYGLNQLNYYATVNRLYTSAQVLAQNQIDLLLTKKPFDPAAGLYPDPNILGNDATHLANGATYTYYISPSPGATPSAAPIPVTIYKDPMTTNNIVVGTIATRIKNTPHTVTTVVDGVETITDLKVRQATVTVAYTFRRRNYTVVMDTLRAAD